MAADGAALRECGGGFQGGDGPRRGDGDGVARGVEAHDGEVQQPQPDAVGGNDGHAGAAHLGDENEGAGPADEEAPGGSGRRRG